MEVVIALVVGVLAGTLLNRILRDKEKRRSLVSIIGKSTLLLTYVLVFVIGLRISQILPEILTRSHQIILALIAFSAIPAILSLVVSYLILRG